MRYYIVQYCHAMRGWTDLPQTATKKAKEAEKVSEEVAKEIVDNWGIIGRRLVLCDYGLSPAIHRTYYR